MWDEFEDHPMRRDYVDPDDYEYEPTPHDEVLKRAQSIRPRPGWWHERDRTQTIGPRPSSSREEGDELLEVAMGPHHPSTHGVFRMDVALDGERVVKLKPVFGYLHRNHEKIAETSYLGSMPYTDRLDYFCSLTNNWAYALAVEKLAGIEVPERAEYIRVITAELTRMQNHASAIGFLMQEMGASGTPLMYAFREREKILDLFEELTGSRMMCNYMRFGGCRVELPAAGSTARKQVVDGLPAVSSTRRSLLTGNEILMARTQGVGVLKPELAVNAGITGPDAARHRRQLRHPQGRSLRHLRPLQVPRAAGRSRRYLRPLHDSHARDARVGQDLSRRCATFPPARSWTPNEDSRLPSQARRGLRPHRSAQGRAGFYLISDGSPNPYRYRVRPPS
jgi:NADH-quinone oxidoreductase subunit D